MPRHVFRLGTSIVLALATTSLAACRREPAAPAVARPTVTLNRDSAALGSPIDITYRFDVTSDAAFDGDYLVMLHVLDVDKQLLWTDDHPPAVPTSQWKPGQTVQYTRTVFVPVYPYVGEATLQVGLYSPSTQKRLALAGDDMARRAYNAGHLRLLPQNAGTLVTFKSGWHPAESPRGDPTVEWHWTKKDAVLAFANPRRDSTLFLDLDTTGTWTEPQEVRVRLGNGAVDQFQLSPSHRLLKRIPLRAAQFGSGPTAEIEIGVDKTFVPAIITNGTNRDARELGIRVFHVAIDPQP